MKMKKFVSAFLASAVALSLVAGCGGGDKKKAEEKKPEAAGAVKVGVFLPLTGDNAAGGELELRGIKLANKLHPEINGKKIELVIADNKSDKAEAASQGYTVDINLYDYDKTTLKDPDETLYSKNNNGPFYVVAVAKDGKNGEVWTTYAVKKVEKLEKKIALEQSILSRYLNTKAALLRDLFV